MQLFSKVIGGVMLATAVGLPYAASSGGWGVASERDAKIVQQAQKAACPAHLRRVDGTCRRGHRSYFYGRSMYGGGPGRGK